MITFVSKSVIPSQVFLHILVRMYYNLIKLLMLAYVYKKISFRFWKKIPVYKNQNVNIGVIYFRLQSQLLIEPVGTISILLLN